MTRIQPSETSEPEQPKVSVIMPVANAEAYVRSAIESVLSQSMRALELIVVNDGSTDTTSSLLEQLVSIDNRIVVVDRAVCSGGPATPRNQALDIAKGEWAAFIDADDRWHGDKLALQLSTAESNGLDFISTDCHRVLPKDFSTKVFEPLDTQSSGSISRLNHTMMLRKNRVITSSMMVKTHLIRQIGFSEDAKHIGVEDYLAWLHLMQEDKVKGAILHLPLVNYLLRADSLSASKLGMARKIYGILEDYMVDGRRLGWRRYWYFLNYAAIAVLNRLR